MSEKRYKATRPDGTDFWSGEIDYGAALNSSRIARTSGSFAATARRLLRLQGAHDKTRLSAVCSPPAEIGVRWSM